MGLYRKLLSVLDASYRNFSLRSKVATALIVSVSVVSGLVMLASYISTHYLVVNHTYELLNAKADIDERALEIQLEGEMQIATEVAGNYVTANAIADTQESKLYLEPYLKNQKHAFAETSLTVADYRGRAIASNRDTNPDYTDSAIFTAMMQSGQSQISLQKRYGQSYALVMALPVRYRLTNQVEGGVVLDIPLASLLKGNAENGYRWIADAKGVVAAGQQPALDKVITSFSHVLQLPDKGVSLNYYLAYDRSIVLSQLDMLLVGYLGIALIAIAVLLIFAKIGARYISEPLEHLTQVAGEITSSGKPQSRIDIEGKDEYGTLANAFNTMFERLSQVYDDLEQLVRERTQEFLQAKIEADKSRNLLYESVDSVWHGFGIYDQEDRLIAFNEAYKEFCGLGDWVTTGRNYEEILFKIADSGIVPEASADKSAWVNMRVGHHQRANGEVLELQRADGRWYMLQEVRSPSGYVVASRIDITALKNATKALAQRELYLRATLDNLPFLFWLKDQDSRFLAVNKTFAEFCGLPGPEYAVGKTDFDVWPFEIAEKYSKDDAEVIAGGLEKHVEEAMDAGHSAAWVETYKKAVMTDDGKVLGTVGFSRDISDRKRVELALAEAELRWSLAMRGANDGVWDWNLKTGKSFYSDRWKTMLGYDPGEIADEHVEWYSRIHPDDLQQTQALIDAHLRGETEFYINEHRLRCKDGSYKWILSRGKAFIDESGEPIRFTGSHTDISESKIVADIIRDRNQQLDAIFALSPDGFVSFDRNHIFKYANPAFYHLTNLDINTLSGLSEDEFSNLLAQKCKENSRFIGVKALRSKLALSTGNSDGDKGNLDAAPKQVVELATAGNRLLEISMRLSDAPTVSQILYVRDVTYEIEVSRIKSEFLSTAAHELRTPMASIFGYSELLLARDFPSEQQREFHKIIHRQAGLISEILNELLDLQRIESRRGKDFVFSKLDIAQLLSETISMFSLPEGRSAPKLLLPDCPCLIYADRSKTIQVINNVLSNAYKYSPDGSGVEISLVKDNGTRDVNYIGIRVTDHGIGMTPEQLARVFDRFYRADTSGSVPGTGLGMSIVKEIVELHHGYCEVVSEYGSGTTVTLWLPADVKKNSKLK